MTQDNQEAWILVMSDMKHGPCACNCQLAAITPLSPTLSPHLHLP